MSKLKWKKTQTWECQASKSSRIKVVKQDDQWILFVTVPNGFNLPNLYDFFQGNAKEYTYRRFVEPANHDRAFRLARELAKVLP